MAVAPEREAEYLAAGHTPVNAPKPETEVTPVERVPAATPAAVSSVKQTAAKSTSKLPGSAPKKKTAAAKK